jgi:hypothetical protein
MHEEIYLTPASEAKINELLEWGKRERINNLTPDRAGPVQPRDLPRSMDFPPPKSFLLLQDLHGGGSALAEELQWRESLNCYRVEVIGVNPVPDSTFQLRFAAITYDSAGTPSSTDLFVTSALSVVSRADEVRDAILAAAGGLWTRDTLRVWIGNPYYDEGLVSNDDEPNLHDDLPKPTDDEPDRRSYVGAWIIEFDQPVISQGGVTSADAQIVIYAEEDLNADPPVFMRGLSVIASAQYNESPTGETVVVRDRFHLARQSPARAGVQVAAIYFPDADQYCVIAIGHRDLTLDLSNVTEFEEPDDE